MKWDSDKGDASLELAMVTPALMLLLLGLLQFGLWYHAVNVVQAAAMEGSRLTATDQASASDGRARSMQVLRSGLGSAIESPSVEVDIGPEVSRVTVNGTMKGLLPIPGLSSISLHAQSDSFRERFRPAGENR